jgi:hypothetical protein
MVSATAQAIRLPPTGRIGATAGAGAVLSLAVRAVVVIAPLLWGPGPGPAAAATARPLGRFGVGIVLDVGPFAREGEEDVVEARLAQYERRRRHVVGVEHA